MPKKGRNVLPDKSLDKRILYGWTQVRDWLSREFKPVCMRAVMYRGEAWRRAGVVHRFPVKFGGGTYWVIRFDKRLYELWRLRVIKRGGRPWP